MTTGTSTLTRGCSRAPSVRGQRRMQRCRGPSARGPHVIAWNDARGDLMQNDAPPPIARSARADRAETPSLSAPSLRPFHNLNHQRLGESPDSDSPSARFPAELESPIRARQSSSRIFSNAHGSGAPQAGARAHSDHATALWARSTAVGAPRTRAVHARRRLAARSPTRELGRRTGAIF